MVKGTVRGGPDDEDVVGGIFDPRVKVNDGLVMISLSQRRYKEGNELLHRVCVCVSCLL